MTALSASTAISSGRVALVNVRQRSLLTARMRVLWVVVGFTLVAVAALFRIAYLGVFQDAPTSRSLSEALLPPRGQWDATTEIVVQLPPALAHRGISGYRIAVFYP